MHNAYLGKNANLTTHIWYEKQFSPWIGTNLAPRMDCARLVDPKFPRTGRVVQPKNSPQYYLDDAPGAAFTKCILLGRKICVMIKVFCLITKHFDLKQNTNQQIWVWVCWFPDKPEVTWLIRKISNFLPYLACSYPTNTINPYRCPN